ncbi:MAG: hypothetical protein V4608_15480 [Bacteroidota bacterium]
MTENTGLYKAFVKNGIAPFITLGITLLFVGAFLIVQSATGKFLPHDVKSLGMSTDQLSFFKDGKIVNFMFHDRVAFGGSLVAVGILYIWLAAFPLRNREPWAWWVLLLSGLYGFGSFLSYLGFGYFDSWHGVGTVLLIPLFITGLYYSHKNQNEVFKFNSLLKKNKPFNLKSKEGFGNLCLAFIAFGLFAGGITIMIVGMTSVFVPQDFGYMKIDICGLEEINRNLIPIIAHDRASFGGGLATIGIMLYFIIWFAEPSRILWETLALAISIGFGAAIGVHFAIGYLDFSHLAPAYFGLFAFYIGLYLSYETMVGKSGKSN